MVTVIVGTQWGDEGKGRVSNFETKNAEMVVRCTGGNNAGHSVVRDGERFALHLLPSSIINPDKMSVIAHGVVINPKVLLQEIGELQSRGISISPKNLAISNRAHVILPIHLQLDQFQESLKGDGKVGTTGRGIGPTYQDKAGRIGIRMCDLVGERDALEKKLAMLIKFHNMTMNSDEEFVCDEHYLRNLCDEYENYGKKLGGFITDTTFLINSALKEGKKIALEGAQSTFLDMDIGNYPYVTSSNPTASGTCAGAGIGPIHVEEVIGVMKAYSSRVGEGPFPTEQKNKTGDRIRALGHEYGTTTGRPRRCGWLDLVMIKYAADVNGLTALAVNHVDTIGKFSEIKVCVGYKYHGKEICYVPVDHENCKPIYKTFKGGWSTIGATTLGDLGPDAVKFIHFIEDFVGIPVAYIGIGPDAKQTIIQ